MPLAKLGGFNWAVDLSCWPLEKVRMELLTFISIFSEEEMSIVFAESGGIWNFIFCG